MKTLRLLRVVAVLLSGWAGPAFASDARPINPTQVKPDIVIVIGDDSTWNDFGCYGSKDAITPNIDNLAAKGLKLTRCYTATAMCAPTRQQLYTGIFPVRNGAYPNHSGVRAGVKSIAHHLGDLGYRVGLVGKKHFKPVQSFPFEIFNKNKIPQFIDRDKTQPYCLLYCSNNSHSPWTTGDPSRFPPAKLTLPPYYVDTPDTREVQSRYLAEINALDDEVGDLIKQIDAGGRADNTLFLFTSEQGAGLPFAKWTCYEAGIKTATVIRWPRKIKPGRVSDAMVQYVDILPTLIEAAGGDPQKIDTGIGGAPDGGRGFDGRSFYDVLTGKSDKLRDVVFAIHTTAGIINGSECYPVRSVCDGRYKLIANLNHGATFTNVVTGDTNGRHGGYYDSWMEKATTDKQAAALVRRYQHRPAIEFYDLQTDPDELNNLADHPAHAQRIATLKSQLDNWMKQQGDQGNATERKAKDRQAVKGK